MYYDEAGGWWNAWGAPGTTGWGLSKFIPPSDTYVTRVEFWARDITTDIDIYLYDDFDGTVPSNLLRSKLNNYFDEAGYHSVQLDSPLLVREDDDVIVVVKFTNSTPSELWPVPVDCRDSSPETGRTYVSVAGTDGSWSDAGVVWGCDVAIRLRTSGSPSKTYVPLIMKNYSP